MNIPGITFDGTAPTMEGTWFNPKTGDVIKIRDTFFENNNYVARTTDGRILNYNQLQAYVRDDSRSAKKPETTVKKTPALQTVQQTSVGVPDTSKINPDSLMTAEDLAILDGLVKPEQHAEIEATHGLQNGMAERMNGIAGYLDKRGQELSVSDQILDRALSDAEEPRLTVQVSWKAPVDKLRFLKENMGITDSDICRWITRTLRGRDLHSDVKDSVAAWVDQLFEKEPKPTQQQTEEKPKGPPKVPKKKVPSKKK